MRGDFDVIDPATLSVIGRVLDGGPAEALAAVDAASEALPTWRAMPPRERADILRRTHDLMLRNEVELAALISAENGKSRLDSVGEVRYAADFFRWFSEEAVRTSGDYGESPSGGTRTVVTRKPVGVAALVTPWNFPAAMAARKIAPALAAGCTVVLKPAAETPMTAIELGRLLAEAGLPSGVVTVVPTTDPVTVVGAWMTDQRVRKISFTGSTAVGKVLLRQAADRVINTSMELGGNAPVIVAEDADLEAAVAGTMIAKFRNGGQACTAANRIYVHADVAEDFIERFGAEVEALNVGAASTGSQVGPLISQSAVDRLRDLVDSAVAGGARISHQARSPSGKGFFFPPTVVTDVNLNADVLRNEIFGPVAPIAVWRDEADLLERINSSDLGLAAYVFSDHLQHAMRIGEALDAGMVGINRGVVSDPSAPFGGMKQSGVGREGARIGLEEFTEVQYLSIDWPNEALTAKELCA